MEGKYQAPLLAVLPVVLFAIGSASQAFSQQGIITTFAGGGPNSPSALSAYIFPQGVAADSAGNIFIAGMGMDQVFRVDPTGNFTVVAGTGTAGFSGDGGPASSAALASPSGLVVDTQGDLFIADGGNQRIRRVDAVSGIITTVAGNGQYSFSGDGGPATSASLRGPYDVALDGQGNLFIADLGNQRVRRVDAVSGIITTVAGNGQSGFSGDGGPATSATLSLPSGVAVDAQGNLFIADDNNQRIRRVDATTGIITTYAGNGGGVSLGDGGPAINATLSNPHAVAVDAHGNVFIADAGSGRIRRVDAATQRITTVAGTAASGAPDGDGGPATSASISYPEGVAVDAQDDIFIGDVGSGRVRRVDGVSGIITTVAGGGSGGDGGSATSALLIYPGGIAIDGSGNVFTEENNRIRRVDAATGIITTVAGNGVVGHSGDGGSATAARLWNPNGVAADLQGNLFIADTNNNRIRRVDGVSGIITTVAGSGQGGYSGDHGPATNARLSGPNGVAVDTQGNLFIADIGNNRIRRVDSITAMITTVAGDGTQAYGGDGGPANSASLNLNSLGSVAVDRHDNLFIADFNNNRVRRVDALTGIITTVAGTGEPSSTGDGGSAVSATIPFPLGVAVDTQGNLFVASISVRRVDAVSGIITTVAGNGNKNFSGDGGPATSASVNFATGVAIDAQGRLFIADTPFNRVRVVPLPPFVALSPASLSFSTQAKGTTSAAQTVTLTNTGTAPLTISSMALSGTNVGDFAEANTCGGSVNSGANCVISVTYTPTATGASAATLTITDNAPGSPHAISLSGTTQPPDFTLAASGSTTSATVTAGQPALYTLSLTPQGSMSGTVNLTCSGAPSLATCAVNPSAASLSGSGAATAMVTVSTTARSGLPIRLEPPAGPWIWVWLLGLLAAVGATLTLRYRLAWRGAWVPLAVAMLGLAFWAGCGGGGAGGGGGGGGGGNSGTPAGTYTLTVTGSMTSGTTILQHNVTLTLTVN
jgi:sugar lactone lactonase YvrE